MGKWQEILDNVEEEVRDEFPEILDARYYQDKLSEIVDGCIPVYNSHLIDCLADNHDLAEVDDEGLLPQNPSVYDIISTAIYEVLSSHANQIYDEEAEKWEECAECGDWKEVGELEKNEEKYEERVCNYCIEHVFSICDSCGNEFPPKELSVNYEDTGDRICNKCRKELEEEEENEE